MATSDSSFDGRFFVAVRTTGIYCLPSCTARKPKLTNVTFYTTREEALAHGFRSCKRCRPDKFPDTVPSWVVTLMQFLREHGETKLNEQLLEDHAGVNRTTIRRHFRAVLGTTPLAFSRKVRLQRARQLLTQGQGVLDVALETGYESLSGFRDAFRREFGKLPGRARV